ncbi:MAG: 23S rRNA (guanosine(2251)-2'-O)-methyltransferase RlmB [Desulfomonilaceae bacterium]
MKKKAPSKSSLIYGIHPVLETVRAGKRRVEAIFLARSTPSTIDFVAKIENLGIPITRASTSEIFSLAGSSHHQGIVARVGPFPYVGLDEFLSGSEAIHGPLLILDQVQDPANFGNIIRSAECLGVPAVIVARDRSVGITAAVEKAAAGASAHISIIRVINLVRVIDELKAANFWIYGTHQESRRSLYSFVFSGKIAVVLGSEGKGMRRLVREKCDDIISIPVIGQTESLNVSQTASIILAEILRQRMERKETFQFD